MGERDEEGVTRPGETPISRARAKSSSKTLILGLLAKEGAVLEFSAGAIGVSLPESWGVGVQLQMLVRMPPYTGCIQ